MSLAEIRQGDSAAVGPCYAKLADGTAIDLTGAKIWSATVAHRDTSPIFTRKNTAGGGDSSQVSDPADPTLGGPFYVYLSSANTGGLTVGSRYNGDIRVKLTTGEVYTVGTFEFKIVDAYTDVPA